MVTAGAKVLRIILCSLIFAIEWHKFGFSITLSHVNFQGPNLKILISRNGKS